MSDFEEFEARVPSTTSAAKSISDRIIGLIDNYAYSKQDRFAVRLALEEALTNAVRHGNGMDSEKAVRIACRVNRKKIRIEIEDEGLGFSVADVPDPTTDENLHRPNGRGIMLMRSFMSLVEFNERGNRVVLEMHREGGTGE